MISVSVDKGSMLRDLEYICLKLLQCFLQLTVSIRLQICFYSNTNLLALYMGTRQNRTAGNMSMYKNMSLVYLKAVLFFSC